MALQSPRFKNNSRLQRAALDSPPLMFPEYGPAVALVQQALRDYGFPKLQVDGVMGRRTVAAVKQYQREHALSADGICGSQTLKWLDADFTPARAPVMLQVREPAPNPMAPPPLSPAWGKDVKIRCMAPGVLRPIRQPSANSCWAAMLTMLLSWRDRAEYPIEHVVGKLGPMYVEIFKSDTGLRIQEIRGLAARAGVTASPLFNPSPKGWEELLHKHGLLWTAFAWIRVEYPEPAAGRHVIMVYGIEGDGTLDGTFVHYVDPGDGQRHIEAFRKFVRP